MRTAGASGEPYVDSGYTRGTIAEARVPLGPQARIPLRVVCLADRVLAYLGDDETPAIDAPCAAFAPEALPDGAKLVFYGVDCKFFGFAFRNPVPDTDAHRAR